MIKGSCKDVRQTYSHPLRLGSHQPEDLGLGAVSHSLLQQRLQRLPETTSRLGTRASCSALWEICI